MSAAIEPDAVETLARKLEAFERTLATRDRAILRSLLHSMMGPWERAAALPVSGLLDEEETALLEELLAEPTDNR